MKIQWKDLARLLHARSLHLSAANAHCSGVKELSGPMKCATEAACRSVPEGHNGGKVELIPFSENDNVVDNKGNSPRYWASLLCWIATVLEGHFGEYHSSSESILANIFYCIFIHPCTNLPLFSSDDGLPSSAFQGCQPIMYKWLPGGFWTLLAQCCWWGVIFSDEAFQHSGNPT